jgi:hypothetical protein
MWTSIVLVFHQLTSNTLHGETLLLNTLSALSAGILEVSGEF